MVAVVTGSAGFIGRVLTSTLLEAGMRVIGIDRRVQAAQPGLTAVTADLLAGDDAVRAALASADVVFHLAGCPGVRDTRPGVELRRHRDNPVAAAAVLGAVPRTVPVVVTSSSSVYGGSGDGRPCSESDSLRPRGGYARSKVLVERLCRERLRAGAAVTVARPFTVAGEGQRPDMALAQWIAAARAGRPLRVLGSLRRTRDVTDVRDAARALVTLAERGVLGAVNVGTGVGQTLGAMVAAVADTLECDVRTVVEPAGSYEVPATLADPTRLSREAGFVPVTDLRDVVARQVAEQVAEQVSGQTSGRVGAAGTEPSLRGSLVGGHGNRGGGGKDREAVSCVDVDTNAGAGRKALGVRAQ